jgi:capsular polysaccharide transport system permease protein
LIDQRQTIFHPQPRAPTIGRTVQAFRETKLENASTNSTQTPMNDAPADLFSRIKNINRIFALAVVAPTVLATLYYGVIASDVYVSESRFVVRSAKQEQTMGVVGALLTGNGFSRTDDDAYPVVDYIESRDALKALNQNDYISRIYSKEGDFVSRFHTGVDSSFESLWKYYGKRIVKIDTDSTSGITILQVRAYSAEDAAKINRMLIKLSENLINQMNDRAAADTVDFAQKEVERAAISAKEAATALAAYRTTHSLFDPDRQSALRLQQITTLQTQLFTAQIQLSQIEAVSPQNPQISALKISVASLQKQIDFENGSVAGRQDSFSQKMTEYERLQLDSQFSDRQLASAMTGLENAKAEAQRKQLYLEELVQPNTPDRAIEPKRVRGVVTVFALGMVCWAVFSMLLASIREHRD